MQLAYIHVAAPPLPGGLRLQSLPAAVQLQLFGLHPFHSFIPIAASQAASPAAASPRHTRRGASPSLPATMAAAATLAI